MSSVKPKDAPINQTTHPTVHPSAPYSPRFAAASLRLGHTPFVWETDASDFTGVLSLLAQLALGPYLTAMGVSVGVRVSLACLRKLLHSRGPLPAIETSPLGPPVGLLCLLFSTDDITMTEWLSE